MGNESGKIIQREAKVEEREKRKNTISCEREDKEDKEERGKEFRKKERKQR